MNKRFILIFILLFTLFLPAKVLSDSYRVVIDDEQDLLNDAEEKLLREKMEELTKYGNVGFFTFAQYSDYTSTYAKELYRKNFGRESGIIFVIDMGKRNIWIYSDGAIYRVINKAYANTITDNAYRYASDAKYYDCAYNVFDQAQVLLEGGRISQPMKYISNALIAIVSALLLNFLFLSFNHFFNYKKESAISSMTTAASLALINKTLIKTKRRRHVDIEVSSGGYSSGGGSSGGGGGFSGGGGGSSGGGGGHSF